MTSLFRRCLVIAGGRFNGEPRY